MGQNSKGNVCAVSIDIRQTKGAIVNIVFVSLRSTTSYLGGAEILTQVIAESLVCRGHRVTIYTAGGGGRSIVRGVCIQQTPLLAFPMPVRTTLLPFYAIFLKPFFRQNSDFRNADIVHAIDSDAIILMSGWQFLRSKFAVTIQDYTLLWPNKNFFTMETPSQNTGVFHEIAQHMRRHIRLGAMLRIQFAICVSNYVANEARKANEALRVAVIGNGVSPLWKKHNSVSPRDIDILYVGKLMPYKGVDVLIQALAKIPRLQTAVIIGEGLEARYKTQVKRLGIEHRVKFAGPVPYPEMYHYYLRAKIVVSPSIWPEPCGRSIIEAMWSGCAVVATNVGGTPESLIDGTHGFLVHANNPTAIAKACRSLLSREPVRCRFGHEAERFARSHYSANHIAIAYERFYRLIKSE